MSPARRPSGLVVALVAALAAAFPAAAAATGTVTRDGGVLTVDTGAGTVDGLIVTSTASALSIQFYYSASVMVGTSGCNVSPGGLLTCPIPATSLDRLVLRTQDQFDEVQVPAAAGGQVPVSGILEVELGPDGDFFKAADQIEPVVVGGDGGADRIITGPSDDTIDGGSGSDTIAPGLGRDDVTGGAGFDEVSYDVRAAPVSVSLNGVADDGELGEGDNVRPGVERIVGGAGNDVLTGGDGPDELVGAAGDDRLDGGGGVDRFLGGEGQDTLLARDGLAERVSCEAGADSAVVDEIDTLNGCETVDSSPVLQPDRDGDGVVAPQDCDDLVAAVRPGAFDVPEDGLDQDCSGADAVDLDRDRDGWPRPLDCDDGNAAIRPGGTEIPGNLIDEDCNHKREPFPVFEARVRLGSLVYSRPSYTAVTGLKITALGPDDRVRVTCRGKGCPFGSRRPKPPATGGDLELKRAFRRARLRSRATLEVTVTRADGVGATTTFAIRAGKPPRQTMVCFNRNHPKAARC